MNHHLHRLAGVIALALIPAHPIFAQETDTARSERTTQLDTMYITGSLLPGMELEQATPLLVITAEQIQRNGFTTVSDALKAMPFASGAVRDSTPIGGGNAQGAKLVNLFGLGPAFTKLLINGHPVANFPLTYNTAGGGNFTDLSNIPMSIVERIEILPGSQSAIYGSDAISGVVNIILKQNIDGINLNLRLGGYSDGGGSSRRIQFSGGHHWGETRLIYALEHRKANPILATHRTLTALRPYDDDAFARNNATGEYFDPGANGCAQMAHLFGGTTEYRQDGNSIYCGSDYTASFDTTFEAEREQSSGYFSLSHPLSEHTLAFADIGYTLARSGTNCCTPFYWDLVPIGGEIYRISREFAPEETGGADARRVINRSHQYDLAFGVRGRIGRSGWDWQGDYSRSWYQLKQSQQLPLQAQMNTYLRERYQDLSQVFVPLTADEYALFSAQRTRKAVTSTDQVSARLTNTALFALPGGRAGLALLADAGRERWDDAPDARYRAGEFLYGAQQASLGKRERTGLTAQLDLPLVPMLKLSTAARYDRYAYSGRHEGSDTWRAGLEFRPHKTLLLRGMLGTSFRAADMAFLYTGETRGNANLNDPYLCDTLNVSRTDPSCRYVMTSYTSGNLDLKPTTAKSRSIGLVFSPVDNLNLHADYLDIKIEDEVRALAAPTILNDEASCRQGGQAGLLPSCEDALARVIRDVDGQVVSIHGGYFNVAYKRMKTLMAGLDYQLDAHRYGLFNFSVSGNFIRDFQQQNDAFSPIVNVIENPTGQGTFFRTIMNASLGWEQGPLSATVFAVRYGSTPNFALAAGGWDSTQWGTPGHDPAWLLFNASVQYRFTAGVDASLIVNNLDNRMPPSRGWTSYPNYNSQLYNVYGRALSVELNWRF